VKKISDPATHFGVAVW